MNSNATMDFEKDVNGYPVDNIPSAEEVDEVFELYCERRRLAKAEVSRKWREDNADYLKAKNAIWRAEHQDQLKVYLKCWRAAHPEYDQDRQRPPPTSPQQEKARQKVKRYQEVNREKVNARRRAKRAVDKAAGLNPSESQREVQREANRKSYYKHREARCAKTNAYKQSKRNPSGTAGETAD